MAETGGSTTQSGILYQNSVAALYLGRLLDTSYRPDTERVEQVRVEAPAEVDDTVVTFADAHLAYIQAKEHLRVNSDEWKTLWKHFDHQFRDNQFQRGRDRLLLWIGFGLQDHYELEAICERAASSPTAEEWQRRLSQFQQGMIDKITPCLSPTSLTIEYNREFFAHIDINILPRIAIERDRLRDWIPHSNHTQKELFRLLRDHIGGEARVKGIFAAHSLLRRLVDEVPELKLELPQDIAVIQKEIQNCGSLLRHHQNTISGTDIHIKRDVVDKVVQWLLSDTPSAKNVSLLLDQAGMGKTVIMRDVLSELEHREIDVVAIKADQQLSGIEDLGELQKKLALSYSVEQIVSRLAQINRVVVLIDQIDALSLSLAHEQQSINIILDLVARLRRIPNVRILLSCRVFDRNTDPRLKTIETDQTFSISKLEETQTRQILDMLNVDYDQLTSATKDLLSVPLHLDLFARAVSEDDIEFTKLCGISSLQELYALIWQHMVLRQEVGSPALSERVEVINKLVEFMDANKRIIAPHSLLQTNESLHLEKAVNWLASRGILVSGKSSWSFLHQTFFDYCYARRFVESGEDIVSTTLISAQGIFERPKLIQIMSYLRDFEHPRYIKALRRLLEADNLRFHLYDLLLRWFGALSNPTEDEWYIAREILRDDSRFPHLLLAMHGNLEWFNHLKLYIPRWLENENRGIVTLGYLRSMIDIAQSESVALLEPFLGKSDEWNERIAMSIFHIRKWQTDDAVQLFEKIVYQLKTSHRRDLLSLETVCDISPTTGCRIIRHLFDEALKSQKDNHSRLSSSFFLDTELRELEGTIENAMSIASSRAPSIYVETMLSWIVEVVTAEPYYSDSPRFTSDALSYNWYDSTFNIQNSFVHSFINALTQVALDKPEIFRPIAQQLEALPYRTPQQLLVYVFRNLPEQYVADALNFLIADHRRFGLGENQYESRLLISTIFPYLTTDQREQLETCILQFTWPFEKTLGLHGLRWSGFEQYLLLHAIPAELLSLEAKKRLDEWQRKFPDTPISDNPPIGTRGGFVPSPIASERAQKMSNRNWLQAMGKYKPGTRKAGPFGGGARELSGVLLNEIKNDPQRFYKLFADVPLDVHDAYVRAFVNGFVESSAPAQWTFDVFQRYARQDERRIRRDLSYAVQKLARYKVPSDIIAILFEWVYSNEGEDESWWAKGDMNGDIYNSYLNSDRGAAFSTLMRILDESSSTETIEQKWKLIEFASFDKSFALRLGAIEELSYMIHHDRERSWLLFESLMKECELLLESRQVREFLHWSLYKNFQRAKPFIESMIANPKPEVQEMGAELACIAAISADAMESENALFEAKALSDKIKRGDAPLRRGATNVFAFNMTKGSENVRAICLENIRSLANDEDEEVRNKIVQKFFSLSDEFFFYFRGLMEDIAESPKYSLNLQFTEYLWKHGMLDPNWTLGIIRTLINKPVLKQTWESGAEELIRFVLRVYTSPTADDATHEEAMNIFDNLMKKYANVANTVLSEWDRR